MRLHESFFSVCSLNLLKSVFFREFVRDFVFHRFQHTRLFASTNQLSLYSCQNRGNGGNKNTTKPNLNNALRNFEGWKHTMNQKVVCHGSRIGEKNIILILKQIQEMLQI